MSVLGLDIGTSATKGVLLSDDGRAVGRSRAVYRLDRPAPGWAEVNAERVGRAAEAVITRLVGVAERTGDPVRAIAAGASGDEAVWVDASGKPIGPTIMSPDTRSVAQAERLARRLGRRRLYALTGLPVHPMYPLVRLAWLRDHDPAAFGRIRSMLCWPEYLALRLGVTPVGEPTLAARSLAYDIERLAYEPAVLSAAGIDPALFPPVVPTGTIIGEVGGPVARRLGLRQPVLLVAGGFDQTMATLGAGVVGPGIAHVGSGTWEAVTVLIDRRPSGETLRRSGFGIGPAIGGGARYAVMGSAMGGAAVAWVHELVGSGRSHEALFRAAADRPTGLLALSHFDGSYSPWLDPGSRGAIIGLDLASDGPTIARGVLEGIAFELREQLRRLEHAGVAVNEVRATGRGADSRTWLQIKADVLDLPIGRVATTDSGALAAACLAAVAIGAFGDLPRAIDAAVHVDLMVEPRLDFVRAYAKQAERHRRVYPRLRDWRRSAPLIRPRGRGPSAVDR